jgi:hypothetical protein
MHALKIQIMHILDALDKMLKRHQILIEYLWIKNFTIHFFSQ